MSVSAVALVTACGSSAKPVTTTTPAVGSTATGTVSSTPAATASTSAAAATANSCNVITQSEAGAALGQAVRPPVRGHATVEGGIACVYYGPNVPAGTSPDVPVGDSVRVVLVTGPKAKKFFDDYRNSIHAQPISGLGDKAYYDGYASISVLKGNAYVRIAVGIANNLSAEKRLAADAVPRM
jgi:lipopolysaccharide export system protein LptA